MIVEYLKQEFELEVDNTRKLLQMVPAKDADFKPSPTSWNMGQLAQHIATIYYWYVGACTMDEYDLTTGTLKRGEPSDLPATLALFESNVEKARAALNTLTEESLQQNWTMKAGGQVVLGPIPRGAVIRSALFNHVYHHRGEMIVYLRATGNKVPGLYGPTYEEEQRRK